MDVVLVSTDGAEQASDCQMRKATAMDTDQLTEEIISAADEVHRASGPGLHEAEYEECLCYELNQRQLSFERQKPLPMQQNYKGQLLDCGYKLNLVVENLVGVQLKYCEKIESIHKSQLLAFLKLAGLNRGLLLNFNVADLRDGIVRIENHHKK
jgi:GxxExxY protein